MKPRLYLETTIPSYLTARPSRDLLVAADQQITHTWWEKRAVAFDLCISELVLEEAGRGDAALARRRLDLLAGITLLESSSEILKLTESLVADGPIPERAAPDAAHIAVASVHSCEYLLTWNCRHIANAELQREVRRIVSAHGYSLPTICTPQELMGDEYGMER